MESSERDNTMPEDPPVDVGELPLAEPIAEVEEDDGPITRDRIVILGRRAAGKTIYLSVLYEKYWKSLDGLTMKAVSGRVHADYVRVAEGIRAGRWPAATLETQHCDLEIEYKGRRQLLVAMDYAGELFRRAFVEDNTNTPETRELVRHIDSAAAIIILIDAAVALSGDVEGAIDDQFGMTQAITRVRNWPGGKSVPIAVVFTKADQNKGLVRDVGSLVKFLKKHYPAVARTLSRAAIFQVAAVQADQNGDGTTTPRPDSVPWQIEKPLVYCLDQIEQQHELQRQREFAEEQRRREEAAARRAELAQRRTNRILASIVITLIVVAGCTVALILAFKS